MILVPPGVRILLAAQPVDFRKGMDGLAALVQQALRADPFAGEVFIFRPWRTERVKIRKRRMPAHNSPLTKYEATWPTTACGTRSERPGSLWCAAMRGLPLGASA